MAVTRNLESLLLRPQATEASYRYIESLVLKRIEETSLCSHPSVDSTADILDLLSSCLYRAGSGWVQVVAISLSKNILIPILQQITKFDEHSSSVVSALVRMFQAYPVLVRCATKSIIAELMRILRSNAVLSASFIELMTILMTEPTVSQEYVQLLVGKSICFLSITKNRVMAAACLSALVTASNFVLRDRQVHNTVLAACEAVASEFGEDLEIRRLCRVIGEFESSRGPVGEDEDINEAPIPVLAPTPITQLPIVNEEPEPKKLRAETPLEHYMVVDESSPRSSCPSLDF
jgi:hypothetical protein